MNGTFYFTCYCQMGTTNKFAHQIGHICQILNMHMQELDVNRYATYEATRINHSAGTVHVWHILLNRHGCYIPKYISHSQCLHRHTHPILLHTHAKTQPTAISTSPVIAKYVLETTMPAKLGIYAIHAKYLTCIYRNCICTYEVCIRTSVLHKGVQMHRHMDTQQMADSDCFRLNLEGQISHKVLF